MDRRWRMKSPLRALLLSACSEKYRTLYKKMKEYNSLRPHHEAGKRYSTQERREFQKMNIRSLESLAKELKINENIRFYLVDRARIQMSIADKVYRF